jgi:hypothetical protein
MEKVYDFCPLFRHPFTCYVAGPTKSGKTYFVMRLVKARKFFIVPPPERVIWCYGRYQDAFNELSGVEFIEGLPPSELLDRNTRTLLIIDDLMNETDASVSNLFTKGSHHDNASIVYLSQNLFNKNKNNRNISINSDYMVLFKNPRDSSQIVNLGRQMCPGRSSYFREAFAEATCRPHTYMLLDFVPTTPDDLRLRAEVFPDEIASVFLHK